MGSGQSVDSNAGYEFILERRDASPSHLLTKIKSFSKLSKNGISKLESAEFEAGDYKWKVIIYLDGDEVGKKANHISVHLSIFGTCSLPAEWEVNAIFNFFVYDHIRGNYVCFRGKAQRFHAVNPEVRLSKLMDKPTLLDPSKGYVYGDDCVFGAEVFVLKNQRYIESVNVFAVEDAYERQFEISDFSKLDNLWSSEEFSAGGYKWIIDVYSSVRGSYVSVYLRCVDSKSFAAHTKVRANFLFNLKNRLDHGKNHSLTGANWFTCTSQRCGFPNFIATSDMLDKGFVVKDCCLLEIRVSIKAKQEAFN